ncbi:MAG: M20/M25/M40 family metallo-hydrolase [Pseudomonadota bacterium]
MKFFVLILIVLLPVKTFGDNEHAQKSLEIYRTLVEIPTVAGRGNIPKAMVFLVDELIKGGFESEDIQLIESKGEPGLIVRYPAVEQTTAKPILFLGHVDVVEALDSDWERPPFALTEDDTFYYGRGTIDNKYGVAMLTSSFIELQRQGFQPSRDLYLVFTGDEESTMFSTEQLAYQTPALADAEFAINSDAGGGTLTSESKPLAFMIQAAEKTYATYILTIKNPGGHSSRPRPDNAIYDLATALKNIEAYEFPTNSSSVTRAFFKQTGEQLGGELGAAMQAFALNPDDEAAATTLGTNALYVSTTRTTCVATMLHAGHAENALAQSAAATINCRLFPGEKIEDVQAKLIEVIDNPAAELVLDIPYPESPTSELRDDVTAAITVAANNIHPDLPVIPYMTPGATDGMHFRSAGIPTWGVSGGFMRPEDMFAHGLNERLPKQAFEDGLYFWIDLIKELSDQLQK